MADDEAVEAPEPDKKRWPKIMLIVVAAAVVVAGAVGGGFALGHSSSGNVSAASPPSSTTSTTGPFYEKAPYSPPTTESNDLPISVGTNSDPGIETTNCEMNSDGTIAIATGTFTSDIDTDTNPDRDNPYSINVYLFDAQNVQVGNDGINFGIGGVDSGQWQVNVDVDSGFTPTQCVALLTVSS